MPSFQRAPKRLAALFGVAFALLLGAEGVLRLANPRILAFLLAARKVHAYSRRYRVDLVPSSSALLRLKDADGAYLLNFVVTTNRFGFRTFDRELDDSFEGWRGPGKARTFVHAVGDSFTMGWGVDASSSYPALLDWQLPEAARVLNLGVDGFGTIAATEKSMALWEEFPARYAVLFFVSNDFDDDVALLHHRDRSATVHLFFESFDALRRRSYLANVLPALRWALRFRSQGPEAAPANAKPIREDAALAPSTLLTPDPAASPDPAPLPPSLAALDRYARFLSERGARLLVLIFDEDSRSRLVNAHCVRSGVDVRLLSVSPADQLRRDGHLNRVGNERVARLVKAWLAAKDPSFLGGPDAVRPR